MNGRLSTMIAALGTTALLAACGGPSNKGTSDSAQAAAAAAPAADIMGASQTPDPGRTVIVVEALTDDKGNNVFRPAKIEAHRGDVIRFTLKAGVHNVDFLADSNPGKTGLPAPSQLLQLPGQVYDVKVTFAKGHYYFQCDPHALLGMRGHLEVED